MKKPILFSDLSKKQLRVIKNFYVQKKVMQMNEKELREFVVDIITHQIHETIGEEEEMEAWNEMSDFFGDQFSELVLEIQEKYQDDGQTTKFNEEKLENSLKFLERNKHNPEKQDMWDD